MERISITEKFAGFAEQWQPKIMAELKGQEVKLVKVQGTCPWHHHDDVDELFLVWRGRFQVFKSSSATGSSGSGRASLSSFRAVSSIGPRRMKRPRWFGWSRRVS
jgi:hypothetical protein